MYTDREAMKRQSSVLLATAQSDVRLMEALLQIEQLTTELEAVKQENKGKVKRRILSSPYMHTYTRFSHSAGRFICQEKSLCEGSNGPYHRSPAVDQEISRSLGDLPYLGSVRRVSFIALTLLVG